MAGIPNFLRRTKRFNRRRADRRVKQRRVEVRRQRTRRQTPSITKTEYGVKRYVARDVLRGVTISAPEQRSGEERRVHPERRVAAVDRRARRMRRKADREKIREEEKRETKAFDAMVRNAAKRK